MPKPDVDQPERVGATGHGGPGASGPLHRCVVAYMEDLLYYSPTLEQHLRDVRDALAILRQETLYVKASKCEFGRGELGFLGDRVSAAGVAVDPREVSAVRDWPTPTSTSTFAASSGSATTIDVSWMDICRHCIPAHTSLQPTCSIVMGPG